MIKVGDIFVCKLTYKPFISGCEYKVIKINQSSDGEITLYFNKNNDFSSIDLWWFFLYNKYNKYYVFRYFSNIKCERKSKLV